MSEQICKVDMNELFGEGGEVTVSKEHLEALAIHIEKNQCIPEPLMDLLGVVQDVIDNLMEKYEEYLIDDKDFSYSNITYMTDSNITIKTGRYCGGGEYDYEQQDISYAFFEDPESYVEIKKQNKLILQQQEAAKKQKEFEERQLKEKATRYQEFLKLQQEFGE